MITTTTILLSLLAAGSLGYYLIRTITGLKHIKQSRNLSSAPDTELHKELIQTLGENDDLKSRIMIKDRKIHYLTGQVDLMKQLGVKMEPNVHKKTSRPKSTSGKLTGNVNTVKSRCVFCGAAITSSVNNIVYNCSKCKSNGYKI